jgi:hypothetical protein
MRCGHPIRVGAHGVIVGIELTVAVGGRRPVARAVGYAVLVGAWLGLLLAALAWVDHRQVGPAAALGPGSAPSAVPVWPRCSGGDRWAGSGSAATSCASGAEIADRVRAALLRAKGELGDATVIPAPAPGRRAPAYLAGQPGASAEELLGLAPARRA